MLLRGGIVMHFEGERIERADVRIGGGGRIDAVAPGLPPLEGEEVVDLAGQLLMPGLVVGHHHLYSALASSMPAPPRQPRNFHEILQLIWWRLDRALELETVRYSALAGAMEAALCGVTTIIDHHASPSCIHESLSEIESGLDAVGLRGVLCYEVTERNRGAEEREAGLAEASRFASTCRQTRFAAMVGAHAAFTISDAGLRLCAELARELGTGVHIHVAEDPCDDAVCREKYGAPLWDRLRKAGLIHEGNIFGHGTHLTAHQVREAGEAGVVFAHNTRSNMNNSVGYAPLGEMLRHATALLGTDGIGSDLFEEFRSATFRSNEGKSGAGWSQLLGMLRTNADVAGRQLGVKLGSISPGAEADIAILDMPPAMPDCGGGVAGHMLFSLASRHVRHVLSAGEWIVRDRTLTRLDADAERARITAELPALWQRLPEA